MAYSISMHYGEFAIVHEDMDDTFDAMKAGTYSTAMRFMGAQMTAMMEAGVLDDTDFDAEAAEMIAAVGATEEDESEG